MVTSAHTVPASRRRLLGGILVFGLVGGALTVILKLGEYRFLVAEFDQEFGAAFE